MGSDQWHLSKSVPITLFAGLIAQSIAVVIWAVQTHDRVGALEKADAWHEQRIAVLEQTNSKLILIEERQNNVLKRLDANAEVLREILHKLNGAK